MLRQLCAADARGKREATPAATTAENNDTRARPPFPATAQPPPSSPHRAPPTAGADAPHEYVDHSRGEATLANRDVARVHAPGSKIAHQAMVSADGQHEAARTSYLTAVPTMTPFHRAPMATQALAAYFKLTNAVVANAHTPLSTPSSGSSGWKSSPSEDTAEPTPSPRAPLVPGPGTAQNQSTLLAMRCGVTPARPRVESEQTPV